MYQLILCVTAFSCNDRIAITLLKQWVIFVLLMWVFSGFNNCWPIPWVWLASHSFYLMCDFAFICLTSTVLFNHPPSFSLSLHLLWCIQWLYLPPWFNCHLFEADNFEYMYLVLIPLMGGKLMWAFPENTGYVFIYWDVLKNMSSEIFISDLSLCLSQDNAYYL